MLLIFVIVATLFIIALTVCVDAGRQIWSDKKYEREAMVARQREAIALLQNSLLKRYEGRLRESAKVEVKEVRELPRKKTTGGRHRISAA